MREHRDLSHPSGLPGALRFLARILPDDAYTRIFEPSLEDLRSERRGRLRFLIGATALACESFRVAGLARLRGDVPHLQRDREPARSGVVERFVHDARYAARMLLKNPAFTGVAVLALALGIGANASIFSLIYGLFLRPLPYAEPDRLVRIYGEAPERALTRLGASVPRYEHIRDHQQVFDGLAANTGVAFSLTGFGDPTPHASIRSCRSTSRRRWRR